MKGQSIAAQWRTEGRSAGWYVEITDAATGAVITDSEKVTFPIDVDEYGRDEAGGLRAALVAEYGEHSDSITIEA